MDKRKRRRVRIVGVVGVGGVVGALLAAAAGRLAAPEAQAAPPEAVRERETAPGAVPVLVELFTSEGCSSCPPAEAQLARLAERQPVDAARVVPLAMHVDYWDRLGWPDPFGTPAWTARQHAYAPIGEGRVYTPQAVIDGRDETVGSRGAALERAVADAARRPHATVAVDVSARERDRVFDLTVRIGALPPGAAGDAEAVVAIAQARARVAVPKGENAGSTLEHTAIARALRVAGPVSAQGGTVRTSVRTPAGVAPDELCVVAFVQERASRRVLGTGTVAVSGP
jgi:hypothetical protein